jgi:glutamyl-tRNA reductase
MRFGVVGINHKLADLRLRELLAKACNHFFHSYTNHVEHTFLLLSTCNRTEIYFSSENLPEAHSFILNKLRNEVNEDFDQKLYSYFSHDCLTHLCRVTTGLDSAIIGETEIQGQVKTAYEMSTQLQQLPSEVHFLFQKSLKISKQIRTKLQLTRGTPTLENTMLHIAQKNFESPKEKKVLLVGASNTNLKILSFLQKKEFKHLTLCNRTPTNHHHQLISWDKLSTWLEYDWIILATKSHSHLIHPPQKELLSKKLIMDLSVPRNANPKLLYIPNINLLNIDQINATHSSHLSLTDQIISQAENLITSSVKRLVPKPAFHIIPFSQVS